MNDELFEALSMLEKEKGIPDGYLSEKIAAAINIAVKHNFKVGDDDIVVELDPKKKIFRVALKKTVVEKIENPDVEILPEQAKKLRADAALGDVVEVGLDTKKFGRIAAQTAKHVIRQGIREVEREVITHEVMSRQHEMVTGVVQRVDPMNGAAILDLGRTEAILPQNEQIPGEIIREGDRLKVYVADVKDNERGPRTIVSRTHPGVVRRLFELEVPEIYDGTVEIMGIAREAGSRTKVSVLSKNEDVDAIGSCIGPKGSRVGNIVNELGGEKIDLIPYHQDIAQYIASALAPADVVSVTPSKEERRARVIVPDDQLSLAIGNRGQNVRLAAKLTGWRIDIRSLSDADKPDEDDAARRTSMAAAFAKAMGNGGAPNGDEPDGGAPNGNEPDGDAPNDDAPDGGEPGGGSPETAPGGPGQPEETDEK